MAGYALPAMDRRDPPGILLLLALGVLGATSENPRVGTWKMNVAKSTFHDGPPPRSEVQVCEAVDAKTIKLTITRVDAQGRESRREYTARCAVFRE